MRRRAREHAVHAVEHLDLVKVSFLGLPCSPPASSLCQSALQEQRDAPCCPPHCFSQVPEDTH